MGGVEGGVPGSLPQGPGQFVLHGELCTPSSLKGEKARASSPRGMAGSRQLGWTLGT